MKRKVVAKFLVLSITASMLLANTPAFAEEIAATSKQTQLVHEEVAQEDLAQASNQKTSVSYRTHVQTYGWQDYVSNGAMSGTEGQAKRLEGINIKLDNQEYEGGITYRTHVQTYGWLGWAKNGEPAGTEGYAKRLEAIEVLLVEKGNEAPVSAAEELAQAQAVVDQAQADYDTAKAASEESSNKISAGSYAFFEDMGSTAALDALNNCQYVEYNNKGDENDATSLENMKLAIEFLEEYLEIRAQEGCTTEVKVSDSMMAMAQADVNASSPLGYNHPQQFGVGENLAWGPFDPFALWYSEKTMCENQGLELTFENAGHYLNLVSEDYNVTGFAVSENAGMYGYAFGQVFSFDAADAENLYTVSEYKDRFMDYYNQLNSAVEETNAKKAALDEAQVALDNVNRCFISK